MFTSVTQLKGVQTRRDRYGRKYFTENGCTKMNSDGILQKRQKTCLAIYGTPAPPSSLAVLAEVAKRRENHPAAAKWIVRNQRGQIFSFTNLAFFVRENPNLFDPQDIVWRRDKGKLSRLSGKVRLGTLKCAATHGIGQLRPNPTKKRLPLSWKGWTWGTNSLVSGDAKDILERNQQKYEPNPTNGV